MIMNLLKSMIIEKEQEGKCFICYKILPDESIFCEDDSGKKAYFCCKSCKIEWIMKKDNV